MSEMGTRNCFGNIICCKLKTKQDPQDKAADSPSKPHILKNPNEDLAAIRIQAAFRAFQARSAVGHLTFTSAETLEDHARIHDRRSSQPVLQEISTTLHYMHSWSRIQSQIRARRIGMVTEARVKQKKIENQFKFEAKLHKLEVEWCGETGTMEEILGRLQQREEAAIKRERALAYAFSHQWRANASQYLGQTSYYKNGWCWSWVQHWVLARPWEIRVEIANPKKGRIGNGQVSRLDKSSENSEPKPVDSCKPGLCNLY